jgi:hypothetical protein
MEAYEQVHGLHVLRLRGDDYEMGRQHGSLLRDVIPHGPLPYFEGYVAKLLGAGLGPTFGRAAASVLQRTVGRKLIAGLPEHAVARSHGIADGAGIGRDALLRAVTMPETYLWVLQRLMEARRSPLAPRYGVPLLGCTSVIAHDEATADGKLLHGRNFDYQGVGAWDTTQTVVFHEPDDGQAYVSVGAADIPLGGATAMNDSGITLVVHQHMASRAYALGGCPVGVVGDLVMRHATTLAEAKAILETHEPIGCWTYILTSGDENASLVYEIAPKRRAVVPRSGPCFGYANMYLDPELADSEHLVYPAHWRNNAARQRRVNELASRSLTADDVAAVLADRGAMGCLFEDSVAAITTVASVVFCPADRLVWVATGRAPVCQQPYVAFDLRERRYRPDLAPLTGGVAPAPHAAAVALYREASEVLHAGDPREAWRLVAKARKHLPDVSALAFAEGLLALHNEHDEPALACFDHAISLGHPSAERQATFHLWRGRCHDVLGDRGAARSDYVSARAGDPFVRAAADKGIVKPWKRKRFGVEMTFADAPL